MHAQVTFSVGGLYRIMKLKPKQTFIIMKRYNSPLACLYVLFFGAVLLLTSCDRVKQDEQPEPDQTSTFKVRANSPVVLDLFKRHNLSTQTTFALKGTPTYGTAQFLSNGMLMYSPNANASAVTDVVTYDACINGDCQSFNLQMQIQTANAPADSAQSCVTLFADVATLNIVPGTTGVTVTLNILANDFFCSSTQPNTSTLGIAVAPQRGTAQIVQSVLTYTFNASIQSQVNPDIIVYKIIQNNITYYGVVVINLTFQQTCPLTVNNDSDSLSVNTSKLLKIFDNDNFCQNLLGTPTFQIITQPTHGSLGSLPANYTGIDYTPTANYVGQDSFVYQLKYADGTTKTGTVSIKVKSNSVPCSLTTNTIDDAYTFPKTQMPNGTAALPVLGNDVYCAQNLSSFQITQQPNPAQGVGTFSIVNGTIVYTLPTSNASFTGTVSCTYQLCAGGSCDSSTVTITIIN